MTKPDLMAELAEVVKQMGFDLPQCHARDAAYAFIKAHHAELEAAVRDAESWRQLLASVGAEQLVAASKKHGDATGVLRDAARYRWLRERMDSYDVAAFAKVDPDGDEQADHEVDATIDQAMHNSAREG